MTQLDIVVFMKNAFLQFFLIYGSAYIIDQAIENQRKKSCRIFKTIISTEIGICLLLHSHT